MPTHNHADIITGAEANAGTINTPLGTLDAAIGDLTGLPTTPKTSVAGSLGTTALGTTATTFSGAIAEHETRIAVSVDTDGTLKSNVVTTAKILDANVTAAKLAANAVETAKILDANVTAAKLAADAVETAKIKDLNVTAAKLAANAVETAKIKDANVTDAKLATDAKVGSLAALTTTAKTSAVAAINEVDALIGTAASAGPPAGIGTSIDTDGTLIAGAVDVAAVLASDVVTTAKIKNANVTGAKISSSAMAPQNLCFDPFNTYLSPGDQWADKPRWYQYSALDKIDPDASNPFGLPTMRYLGTGATLTGKTLWLTDMAINSAVTRGTLVVRIPTGTSARIYARYMDVDAGWLGIANVGSTIDGDDSVKTLTCSIEAVPATAVRLALLCNRISGSGDIDIYAWHVGAGEYSTTIPGHEANPTHFWQEIIDARGSSASIDARLDAMNTAIAAEPLPSYEDTYGKHLLRSYMAQRAKINALESNAEINILTTGDSWTYGICANLADKLHALYGNSGGGFLQFQDGYNTVGGSVFATTGTWAYDNTTASPGVGFQSISSSDSVTPAKITVTATATNLTIHYLKQAGGGSFRWRRDAGAWTTVDTDAAEEYATESIAGLSSASHDLEIEIVSGGVGVVLVGVDVQDVQRGVRVSWCGRAGAKAADFIVLDETLWAAALQAHAPHLITLQLGVNDWAAYPYTTWTTQMNTLIDRIQAALPATDILLITQSDVGAARTYPMSDYAAALRDIAQAQVCALFDNYMNWGPYADGEARGLYVNTTHPDGTGYNLIADLIIARMQL